MGSRPSGSPRAALAHHPMLAGLTLESNGWTSAAVVSTERLLVMLLWVAGAGDSKCQQRRESQGSQFLREGEKLQPFLLSLN